VLLLADGHAGRIAHLDDLGGMLHGDLLPVGAQGTEFLPEDLLAAHQHDREIQLPGGLHRPPDNLPRSVIPPHRVNGNFHRWKELKAVSPAQ
jgi:hypothetical protein